MVDLLYSARAMVTAGKGLLAADESNASADDKRLAPYGIEVGEEMRREFRDMLLATPGMEQYISGVILFSETLDQKANDGTPFPELLEQHGIIPGIKVDEGLEPFPESPDETITKGLIGLAERLQAFKQKYNTGFTKWRAAITIDGDRLPSSQAIVENAKRLALYACEAQKAGMVPMVEPEVLLEGTHSRKRAREVIEQVMHALVQAMEDHNVDLTGVIVKTSMAVSGSKSGHKDTPEEVAEDTLGALMATIPVLIPGIVFLSGGQTPDEATANLTAIVALAKEKKAPWPLTYSYARALQQEALEIWKGKPENVDAARAAFLHRLKLVSEATQVGS